jgi:hypothetical protein
MPSLTNLLVTMASRARGRTCGDDPAAFQGIVPSTVPKRRTTRQRYRNDRCGGRAAVDNMTTHVFEPPYVTNRANCIMIFEMARRTTMFAPGTPPCNSHGRASDCRKDMGVKTEAAHYELVRLHRHLVHVTTVPRYTWHRACRSESHAKHTHTRRPSTKGVLHVGGPKCPT